jgi:hypothetical protein
MFGLDDILGGVGSFIGDIAGNGDRDRAAGYLDNARQGYEAIDPNITAERIHAAQVDPSARAAQMDAISQLQNQYRSGGLDAITRARMGETQNQANQVLQTGQANAAQDAARRGVANSATSVQQQQLAASQAANLANTQGQQTAAAAQQGRQAAIQGAATAAGAVRSGDEQRAAAQDAIARFNAANSMQAQQATVGNKLGKAGGVASVYGAQAGQANADADRTRNRWAGLGEAAGAAGDALLDPTGGFAKKVATF